MTAALQTAAGKQPQSRFIALGTRPADPRPLVCKDAGRRRRSCAEHTRPARTIRNSRRRTWAKANPSLPHMPDLAGRDTDGSRSRPARPVAACRVRRAALEPGKPTISPICDPAWRRPLALYRGRGGERDGLPAWGIDLGTSAAQSAIACLLAGHGRAGRPLAAFPDRAFPGRPRTPRWRRRPLSRVRPAR